METKLCVKCGCDFLPLSEFKKGSEYCKECDKRKDYERKPRKVDVPEIKFNEVG